jgi:hypothetical protein
MRLESSERSRRIQLERSQVMSCREARPLEVRCFSGVIWLTLEGDSRDVFLKAGDQTTIPAGQHAVLGAMESAAFALGGGRPVTDGAPSTGAGWQGTRRIVLSSDPV